MQEASKCTGTQGKEITSLVFHFLLPKQVPSVLSSKIMNNFCYWVCHLSPGKKTPKPVGFRFEVVSSSKATQGCLPIISCHGDFGGFCWPFCFPLLFPPLLNVFFHLPTCFTWLTPKRDIVLQTYAECYKACRTGSKRKRLINAEKDKHAAFTFGCCVFMCTWNM